MTSDTAPAAPPPRAPRTSVMLTAHLFTAGEALASAHRVLNLSATGLCITQPGPLAPHTMVAVSIGAVEHAPAELVWVEGGLGGLQFLAPIDLDAARRRRVGGAVAPPAAGWLGALDNAYRRAP